MFFSKFREQKSCVPEASLLDYLQMESAFFGTRRAAGLLQQFRRLSFCCGPCMLIILTSFTKIHGPHTIPVPTLRPCLTRTAFSFTLVRSFVATIFIALASELVRKLVYSATAPLPIGPADAGLRWEPCGKILAAFFPASIGFGGGYAVVEVQWRPDKTLDFFNQLV